MEITKQKNADSITYSVTLNYDQVSLFVSNPIINLKEHLENELGNRVKNLTVDLNIKPQVIIEIDIRDSRWIDEDNIRIYIQQSVLNYVVEIFS